MVIVATVNADEREIISGPDIISRGFVYVRESEELMEEIRAIATKALNDCLNKNVTEWNEMKTTVKDKISKHIYTKTKRSPMILPVIMDV
jgi:ribonuclease J